MILWNNQDNLLLLHISEASQEEAQGQLASRGAELQRLYALSEIRVALISHFTGLNVSLNPAPK